MSSTNSSFISRRNFVKDISFATAGAAFAAGIRPVFTPAVEARENSAGWYENIYRQFHIDYEFGDYDEIFKNFDAEATAQIFDEAGIQMVSYFAKCASGYSYYPTEIGVQHPGLKIDYVEEMTRALKKRGIKCFIYLFPARERRLQKTHPDWIFKAEGLSLSSEREVATMCFTAL